MKNKKIIILVAVIVVIMIIVGIVKVAYVATHVDNTVVTEDQTSNENEEDLSDLELTGPDYTPSVLYDQNGEEVALSDYAEKPMVLFFFNAEEEASAIVLEILENLYETYSDDVNFVYISLDGNTSLELSDYYGTLLNDTDSNALNDYDIEMSPTLAFVNSDGQIINTIEGETDEDTIDANLSILSENY